jgi:predicted MFS family arabinose efflux permease
VAALPPSVPGAADPPLYSRRYLRYALGLLTVFYIVNFIDRQILAILLESIKRDLGLSDSQLGLLSGTAFGIFYATLGIPIARLADVFSRKWVITLSLTIWSGMTALCGTAAGFTSLLAYRVGVGVGEAGGSPPAHSMISDYFPPERRATALGVFSLGVPLGILIGFAVGGWLDETLGWRRAFVIVGLPGVLLAAVGAVTLREPPRGHSEGIADVGETTTAREVITFLWGARSFRHLSLASGLYAFVGYSIVNWAPAYLIRSFGMGTAEIGLWLSLVFGLGGGVGVLLGGVLADRWAQTDRRGMLYVPALAMLAALPFGPFIFTADSATVALSLLCVPAIAGLMYQAPAFAVTQSLVAPPKRATASAVLLFVVNIIGLAMGPAVTGILSDALAPRFGDASLGYALLIVSCGLGWSAFHFWRGSRTLVADLDRVRGVAGARAGVPPGSRSRR